jgi:hypothetical protein
LKKSNFLGLFEKDGAKLDRLCLKLDNHDKT